MYQIFKDQLEKSKLIISGVKRNQRLGRDAGVEESVWKPFLPKLTNFKKSSARRAMKPMSPSTL